jgi:lipopolysaccharide export system permease protein
MAISPLQAKAEKFKGYKKIDFKSFFKLSILDKYIIKKYLSTFGFVVMIFTLVACVIDFSEKADAYKKEAVTKREIFFDYYPNYIPHINMLLFPLYALIAVIFFTSRMAYNSEIISVFNAGISFKRLMRPYLIGGIVIASIHLLCNHYIVPQGNKTRLKFEHKYIATSQDKGKTDNVHMFLDANTKIFIGYYRKNDTTARDFRIEHYENNELTSIVKAENASWKGYPNKWQLQAVQKRSFKGLTETLQTNIATMDTTLNLTPDDFVRFINQNEMLTTPELYHEITKLEKRGMGGTKAYEIEVHRRTSEPFTILILTLMGMALAARKVRGGIGFHLAIGIGVGAIFIFLSKFSVTFATQPGIPAIVGVWLPNILFGMIAAYLVANAQK